MNKYILGILGLLTVSAAVFFTKINNEETMINLPEKGAANTDVGSTMIIYTNDGFSPSEVTVKSGTTVTFVNQSDAPMWVASATHPTHTLYPEFDEKASVPKGQTYSFTFMKLGAHPYHNHVLLGKYGKVIVE